MARYYLCNIFRALVINTSDDAQTETQVMQISALQTNSRESYRFSLIWTYTNLLQMINKKESIAKIEFLKWWDLFISHALGTQKYLGIHSWVYSYTQDNALMYKKRNKRWAGEVKNPAWGSWWGQTGLLGQVQPSQPRASMGREEELAGVWLGEEWGGQGSAGSASCIFLRWEGATNKEIKWCRAPQQLHFCLGTI